MNKLVSIPAHSAGEPFIARSKTDAKKRLQKAQTRLEVANATYHPQHPMLRELRRRFEVAKSHYDRILSFEQ